MALTTDLAPRVYAYRWTRRIRPLRPLVQCHKNPRPHGPPVQPQQVRGLQRAVPPGPYAMVYLLAFALSTALLVHTILYHARAVYNGVKRVQIEDEDVHAKLMRAYPEVPDSWYASICLVFFMTAIVTVEVWPTDMPVWALALSVLVPTIYLLPCGFIFAVTGQGTSINLLAEIIPGVLLNGRPLANMVRPTFLFTIGIRTG
jgi:hypothetical protein